jgi:hypothetical protein
VREHLVGYGNELALLERAHEGGRVRVALGRILAERALEDVVVDRRQLEVPLTGRGWVFVDDAVHGELAALDVEQLLGCVGNAVERPQVHSGPEGALGRAGLLQRAIPREPEEVALRGHGRFEVRDPEVHELGRPSASTNTFPGLMSRWTIPERCA